MKTRQVSKQKYFNNVRIRKKPSKENTFRTKYTQISRLVFYSIRQITCNMFVRTDSNSAGWNWSARVPCWEFSLFSSTDCLKQNWHCTRKPDVDHKNAWSIFLTSVPLKTELIPWIELTLSGKSSARICLHKALYTWSTLWASSSPVPLSHDLPCICRTQSSWLATKVSDAGSTPPCLENKIKLEQGKAGEGGEWGMWEGRGKGGREGRKKGKERG